MSLHIPTETYETLFRDSGPIPGVYSWTYESCHYGRGCTNCDVSTAGDICDELIPQLMTKHDLSPTQAFLCVNDKFTVVQLKDYPEYFV